MSETWRRVGIVLLTILILFVIVLLIIILQLDRCPDNHFKIYDHHHLRDAISQFKENNTCTTDLDIDPDTYTDDESKENYNYSDPTRSQSDHMGQYTKIYSDDKNNKLDNINWKTGDILAIAYNNIHGKLVKVFTGSIWTHIGMVYRPTKYMCDRSGGELNEDEIYIIEMARYSRSERGLVMKPLKKWVSWNEDNMIGYRSYDGRNEFPIEEMEYILEESEDYDEDLLVTSWLKTMVDRSYYKQDKDYYYCSEFIVHMMQQIGVLRKKILPCSFQPWQLLYSKMDLHRGFHYAPPILFRGK